MEGLKEGPLLAMQAALGDPLASNALRLLRESAKPDKMVGETGRIWANQAGEYAPTQCRYRSSTGRCAAAMKRLARRRKARRCRGSGINGISGRINPWRTKRGMVS